MVRIRVQSVERRLKEQQLRMATSELRNCAKRRHISFRVSGHKLEICTSGGLSRPSVRLRRHLPVFATYVARNPPTIWILWGSARDPRNPPSAPSSRTSSHDSVRDTVRTRDIKIFGYLSAQPQTMCGWELEVGSKGWGVAPALL